MLFTVEVPPCGFFWTDAPEELVDQADQANMVDWLKTGHMRGWNERPSRGRSVLEGVVFLLAYALIGVMIYGVFGSILFGVGAALGMLACTAGHVASQCADVVQELRAHRAERRMKRYMRLDVTAFVARAEAHLDMMRLNQPRKLGCYERFMSQEWRREMLDAVISENLERVRLFMEEEAASTKAPSPIVQAFQDDLLKAVDREVDILLFALADQEVERRGAEWEQRRRYRLMEAEQAARRELAAQQADSRAERMVAYLGLGCNTEQAAQLLRMEADLNQTAEESPADSATATS